jgi:hypothetical protein
MISALHGAISVAPQAETDLEAAATMTSSTSDFLAWSTKPRFTDRLLVWRRFLL